MKKVNLLSKAEMKKVMGGNVSGPCGTSDCTTNDDCKNDKNGNTKCKEYNCISDNSTVSFCVQP